MFRIRAEASRVQLRRAAARDEDAAVRGFAACALFRVGEAEARPEEALALLASPDPELRAGLAGVVDALVLAADGSRTGSPAAAVIAA